jgi:hypothetical protein
MIDIGHQCIDAAIFNEAIFFLSLMHGLEASSVGDYSFERHGHVEERSVCKTGL